MKLAELIFDGNVDTSSVEFKFNKGNRPGVCLTLNSLELKQIWEFLNQDILESENNKKVEINKSFSVDEEERAYKKQKDIDAIKKAYEEKKKVGRSPSYNENFDKEVVRLHDKENMNFNDISKKLKCSPTTVKTHYDKYKEGIADVF